jgi:hypothetical protein
MRTADRKKQNLFTAKDAEDAKENEGLQINPDDTDQKKIGEERRKHLPRIYADNADQKKQKQARS